MYCDRCGLFRISRTGTGSEVYCVVSVDLVQCVEYCIVYGELVLGLYRISRTGTVTEVDSVVSEGLVMGQ